MNKIIKIILFLVFVWSVSGLAFSYAEQLKEGEVLESEMTETEATVTEVTEATESESDITENMPSVTHEQEEETKESESDTIQEEAAGTQPQEIETAKPDVSASETSLSEGLSKKISLDLRNMDIIDTIKFLSLQGNLNIVTSKNVSGRITLFLSNVTISDILDVILFTNNLACEKKKGIITIITEAEYQAIYGKPYSDKRLFKTANLKYADANNVFTSLSNIKSDIGTVIADTATATLILIDVPEKIEKMQEVIDQLDLPTVQRVIPTVEEVFELSYAKAKDIEPEISKILTENIGSININEGANKIMVRDLPHKIESIRRLVEEFDAKTRQVLIKAKIVEVTLSNEYSIGIDWSKIINDLDTLTLTGSLAFAAPSSSTSYGQVSVGTLTTDNYTATLKAIEYIGKTTILSSPHIAVTNNQEAKFMVGSREAYVTSVTTTGEVTTTTSETVEFIDVGVNLYVTPTINKDGFIKMHIKPEVSSVREWLTTTEGNKIPIIDTSNVETDVLIKDGKTVVIAGLIKDTIQKTASKVPVLGDIPLFGWLFKRKSDDIEKKELIVFLTPYIISGEADILYEGEISKPRKPLMDEEGVGKKKPRKPAKK